MVRVTHVVDGLDVGGAEVMLERLVAATRDRFDHSVVSLTDIGPVGRRIAESGVPVAALGLQPRVAGAGRMARLPGLLRRTRPDVIQTWLYQADILAGLSGRLLRVPVLWGVHRVDLDPSRTTTRMRVTAWLGARLSPVVPRQVVCCSASTLDAHAGLGYRRDRMVVIPNGFELPSWPAEVRPEVRAELGLAPEVPLVGLVARWDPQKDHATFARAAGRITAARPDVAFVLCGKGVDGANDELRSWLAAAGALERSHLLGLRHDVGRIQAALDVAVSSSAGEAFPLAVGEAMAAGVPCVVTDVGDSALLVGSTGRVVPRGDDAGLAAGVLDVLALTGDERRALGAAARERIAAEFSLAAAADRYEELWRRAAP
jgi:glycosyltransferase involved in cell wall biosynthesis